MSPDGARAQHVLTRLGLAERECTHLAAGLSSDAWLISAAGPEPAAVLRIAKPPGTDAEFRREHAILAALTAAAAPVPAPVAGSWELADWAGPPFSVTTFVAGATMVAGEVMDAAGEIARFVRIVQSTPPPPQTPDLARRFARAPLWPVDSNLDDHPVSADPDLAARLVPFASEVAQVVAVGPDVLVHSDLHEENILRTATGAAFLDFGRAFAGSPLWEFASLAFFLGWPLAERVVAGFDAVDLRSVQLVALSFALYRWAVAPNDAEEADHSAAFIAATVAALAS